MTRAELQTKLVALASVGDAAAVATLNWIDELTRASRVPVEVKPTGLTIPERELSPEEVATAATRKANGLPEVPDPTQFSHGDVVRMGTERVPNGGTGEG